MIGGPGAFVVEAESFEAFGQSLISKLIKEIAEVTPRPAVEAFERCHPDLSAAQSRDPRTAWSNALGLGYSLTRIPG